MPDNEFQSKELHSLEDLRTDYSRAIAAGSGLVLSGSDIKEGQELYEAMRFQDDDIPQAVGLFGEDLDRAFLNAETVFIELSNGEKHIAIPLFVPVTDVEWYNKALLQRQFGDRKGYYFAQPVLPTDMASEQKVLAAAGDILAKGGYIIQERPRAQQNEFSIWHHQLEGSRITTVGLGEFPSRIDLFVGRVEVDSNPGREIKKAPSFYHTYREAIDSGEIQPNDYEGASVADTIAGEEAERLWQIYQAPFAELGENHPIEAGFAHKDFLAILEDPNIAKVVHRVEGEITTLMLFVNDLSYYFWFDQAYFEKHEHESLETDNVYVFPGIVSDETKRGMNYSYPVVELATKIFAKRGTDFTIAFECSEISSQYIPTIVKSAIELSGSATVSNMDEPVSTLVYEALL